MRFSALLCAIWGANSVLSSAIVMRDDSHSITVGPPDASHISVYDKSIKHVDGEFKHWKTFSFNHTFPSNKTLLYGEVGHGRKTSKGHLDWKGLYWQVVCVSCETTGTIEVSSSGVEVDEKALSPLKLLKEHQNHHNASEIIKDAVNLPIRVHMKNLGAHFLIKAGFYAGGFYVIPLFKSETPLGIEIDDKNKLGLILSLSLILGPYAGIDFTFGWDVSFPQDITYVLDAINGDILEMFLDGAKVSEIPVHFNSGSIGFTAWLRLKLQVAAAMEAGGVSFNIAAGVFYDLMQYKLKLVYEPHALSNCTLEGSQAMYQDYAAFAIAEMDKNGYNVNAGPTFVSTHVSLELGKTCFQHATPTAAIIPTSRPELPASAPAGPAQTPPAGGIVARHVVPTSSPTVSPNIATSNTLPMTTSTVTSTSYSTRTTCAPHATDCSGKIEQVVSKIIVTTTICPVSTGASSVVASSVRNNSSSVTPSGTTIMISSSPSPSPTTVELTTRTLYDDEVFTVTSCKSMWDHCPTHLQVPLVQTVPVVRYVTVCPIDQTEFPSVSTAASVQTPISGIPASITADMSKPVPTPPQRIIIDNPRYMVVLETPIIRSLDMYVPPLPTGIFVANATIPISATNKHPNPIMNPSKAITTSKGAATSSGLLNPTVTPIPSSVQVGHAATLAASSIGCVFAGMLMSLWI
ncbi:hypothetical protein HYFRA_00005426 [Hymenoscyphus fraxineus]|uniref:Uncharacterized protein n=1 Tax=Hymenoscyphus fraxineus TaxID=746836 RepID=A0A9N9KQN6_9HELO|nr:hypothetical protein HYFRA_00005426 [Hymenoscyphus fraxineus]